jgi:hypothetical protein
VIDIREVEREGEGVGKGATLSCSTVGSTFGMGATIRTPKPVRLADYTPKALSLDLTDLSLAWKRDRR